MKNHKIQNLLTRPLALLCCAALLASCYSEDEMDGCFPAAPEGGKATVRIGVTAERSGNAPELKAGSDGNAQSGEYIHQLCVLIVDEATQRLEWKFLSDGSTDPVFATGSDAATGNLERWTSEPIEISTGEKTIYAFANWAGVQNTDWNSLIGLSVGTTPVSSDPDQIVIADPASTISLGTEPLQYIPMSGSIAVTVTANTGTISLPIDRLVSRVRLSLQLPEGVTLAEGASLEFAGCAQNVGLFRTLTDEAQAGTHAAYTFPLNATEGTTAQTLTVGDFYVNETLLSQPFTVTLHTGNTTGAGIVDYTAQTALIGLPRNSIYPLTLSPAETEPGLQARAWLSDIGDLPVEIVATADAETYLVTGICVGAQFELSISSITHNGSADIDLTSVSWILPDGQEGIFLDGGVSTVQGATVSGYISADDHYIGQNRTLQAHVAWQEGGKTYERVFNVVISNLFDMFDAVEVGTRSAARGILTRSLTDWLQPETLILFTKK